MGMDDGTSALCSSGLTPNAAHSSARAVGMCLSLLEYRPPVISHLGVRPFAFTYAAFSLARFQLFDSFRRFFSEGRRLTCDAYLAEPFDLWHAPV